MKKNELEKLIKSFTYKTLLNESIYDFKGSINIVENYIEKANDLDEFVELIKNDPRLENNQGYWELMRECYPEYSTLVKNYLGKICKTLITTNSDVGSLKIGNDNFKITLSNGYGDGTNNVYIIDKKINLECLAVKNVVEGNNISIYEYDCSDKVAYTLNGKYMIYSFITVHNQKISFNLGERIFAFVKIN